MKTEIDFMKEFPKTVTCHIHLKRVKEFKLRVWIAIKLIKIAVAICHFNCEVEQENAT